MSFLIVLILLSHITYSVYVEAAGVQPIIQHDDKKQENSAEPPKKDGQVNIRINSEKGEAVNQNVEKVPSDTSNKKVPTEELPKHNTSSINSTVVEHKKFKPAEVMESGALVRGVLVVVALSGLIIIYMAVKTYYGKRNKPAMVRKYGIRTRRSDIEMTPLPLEEDEDDETLFEVGSTNR